ncbi:uncharacterized protein ACR2FA_002007 [Aphomia sociella]
MESIQHTLEQMKLQFDSRMTAFQESLSKASATPVTLAALSSDFLLFKSFVTETFGNLQQQIMLIAQQQDQIEMHTRRKMLLLHGVSEDSSSNILSTVSTIITEKLKVSVPVDCITRCHRMGRITNEKPRPLLIKFRSMEVRDTIWYAKTRLKRTGITVSEFLTKSRHDSFMAARRHFGMSRCWTRNGSVVIDGLDGARHRVKSIAELNNLISAMPITAEKVIPPPGTSAAQGGVDLAGATRNKRNARK